MRVRSKKNIILPLHSHLSPLYCRAHIRFCKQRCIFKVILLFITFLIFVSSIVDFLVYWLVIKTLLTKLISKVIIFVISNAPDRQTLFAKRIKRNSSHGANIILCHVMSQLAKKNIRIKEILPLHFDSPIV